MYIDSYRVQAPDVEVLYYFDTEPSATLMVAPYSAWCSHCTEKYDGSVELEYYTNDRTDVEQRVFQLEISEWFRHISKWQANEVVKGFVSSCLSDPELTGAHFFA